MTQVTARKYRPKSFQEMVGQLHVLQPLINALKQQRLHHAYLFTGTRGVGKTTLARILAKCFNCEQGVGPEPCGVCDACQSIDKGCFVDVIEVDAASRTKVEDTRELLDNVQYLPTQGRFKIYIIDEVHMLSTSSFNALLKTLEEPPAHVKFLLATTDPQKLPVTVLSRCLQFHLKHLEPELIAEQLARILKTENIPADQDALTLLAEAGQGSMRDALSLLDQAIAHGANAVRTDSVRAMLGTLDPQTVTHILSALHQQDGVALMNAVEAIAADTGNFEQALQALIQALHDIALLQTIPGAAQLNQARYERVKPFAKVFTPEEVQLYYQIALHGRRDLPWAPSARAGFEMSCMRLLAFAPVIPRAEGPKQPIPDTHDDLPLEEDFYTESHPKMEAVIVATKPVIASADLVIASAAKQSSEPETDLPPWDQLLPKLKLTGMASALASHCVLGNFNGHLCILHLAPKHAPLYTKAVADRIAQSLTEFMKKPISVEIKLVEAVIDTPAQRRQEADEQAFAQAKTQLESDPVVQQLVETFDAKINEINVKSS
jgi:DNA polymerase-3 subunit gamma/tau